MRYTEAISVAAKPQEALKITIVAGKHHPTRVGKDDIMDWSTERPLRRQGIIVEGQIIQTMKEKTPTRLENE